MEQQKEVTPRSRARAKVASINWSQLGWTFAGYACQGLILGASSALGARMIGPSSPAGPDLVAKSDVITPIRGVKAANA